MARPKTGREWKVQTSIRIDPEFDREIKFVADSIFANKSTFMMECFKRGYEEIKTEMPVIAEASRNFRERQTEPLKKRMGNR